MILRTDDARLVIHVIVLVTLLVTVCLVLDKMNMTINMMNLRIQLPRNRKRLLQITHSDATTDSVNIESVNTESEDTLSINTEAVLNTSQPNSSSTITRPTATVSSVEPK